MAEFSVRHRWALFAFCDWCNKQCSQWVVMGDIPVQECAKGDSDIPVQERAKCNMDITVQECVMVNSDILVQEWAKCDMAIPVQEMLTPSPPDLSAESQECGSWLSDKPWIYASPFVTVLAAKFMVSLWTTKNTQQYANMHYAILTLAASYSPKECSAIEQSDFSNIYYRPIWPIFHNTATGAPECPL